MTAAVTLTDREDREPDADDRRGDEGDGQRCVGHGGPRGGATTIC